MAASTIKYFDSQIKILGDFNDDWSQEIIKQEPMFFNASVDYALNNGGPITKSFVNALPDDWLIDSVFDSRIHMLMPGWYPAIPGWHHDDVPRPPIPHGQHFITAGQPDYDNPRYLSQHIMGLVNGNICPTEFAIGKCEMPAVTEGSLIYRRWHIEVEKLLENKRLQKYKAESGKLIQFDWQTFHTGIKAISNGWRWFGRISRFTDRINQRTNEIRSQVQVYLEFPMEGW